MSNVFSGLGKCLARFFLAVIDQGEQQVREGRHSLMSAVVKLINGLVAALRYAPHPNPLPQGERDKMVPSPSRCGHEGRDIKLAPFPSGEGEGG